MVNRRTYNSPLGSTVIGAASWIGIVTAFLGRSHMPLETHPHDSSGRKQGTKSERSTYAMIELRKTRETGETLQLENLAGRNRPNASAEESETIANPLEEHGQ